MDWFAPAYKAGGPIQSITTLVESYGGDKVKFNILCSNYDLDGTMNKGVSPDTWNHYNDNTDVWYCSKPSPGLINNLLKTVKPEIIFVVGIYSFYFNLLPLLLAKSAHRIISVRGMLHPGALSQKPFKKKCYLRLLKLVQVPQHCSFHATDEQEKKYIQQVFSDQVKVYIAGNFPHSLPYRTPLHKNVGQLNIVSVALISPMKNILLVLAALKECKGQIRYDIYGPVKDAVYWERCLQAIKLLPSNIQVEFHGDIPPMKVADALDKAHVFILPSKSENFGHAFYEALSAGKPVITSNNTPWNQLQDNTAGINVHTDEQSIAQALDYFTGFGNEEYIQWSKASVTYCRNAVDIEQIKGCYDDMFNV